MFQVIGGSSVLNSMVYIRGNRRDYDNWEAMGNTGWAYKDVLPYFIKSENNLQIDSVDRGYHGVGGYMPVSRYPFIFPFEADLINGAREMGQRIHDLNGESQIGFMIAQTITKKGIRFSSSHAFLRPVKNRKNLDIMLNTLVTKVLINSRTKKAFGVEVIRGNGRKEVILSTKEVIVCGGAIGSPKILLQSGLGDEKELDRINIPVVHNLLGVGRNLHDHVTYQIKFTTNQSNFNDLNWAVARTYLMYRDGAMSTTGDSIVGFMQTRYANERENYPDIRFQFGGYQARCSNTGRNCEIYGDVIDGEIPTRQVTMRSILVQPKSRGYLTLRDDNPLSYPKLFPRYLSNPADIPPLIEGIKFLLRLSRTDALKKYGIELDRTPVKGCESFSFGSDRYWECAIRRETRPDNHQAGSCRMGPDNDPEAVVDPQLRVRGVKGLRVVDASIMPKVVAGNIHGPIVMIAEKASDLIKQYWFSNYPYGF